MIGVAIIASGNPMGKPVMKALAHKDRKFETKPKCTIVMNRDMKNDMVRPIITPNNSE